MLVFKVTMQFDNTFPQHWIGQCGCIDWTPHSPNLTPDELFLGGVIEERVFEGKHYVVG